MRPRRDDEEWFGPAFVMLGTLHNLGDGDEEKPDPAGKLYIPDPEQRNGWREFYVKPAPSEKPGARPIGFGR